MSVAEKAQAIQQKLVEIRRDFHMYPELSGEEERTAGIVAAQLKKLGLDVEPGVGGHGVVGVLRGAKPGPVVAWRADMDAFPHEGDTLDVPYKSRVPGVKHVCGHDVHTTVALGIAEVLVAQRESIAGTIKFIFQPAEENATGARAMIAEGVLDNPRPEAIFGLHVAPFPVGTVVSVEGLILPGQTTMQIDYDVDGASEESVLALTQTLNQTLLEMNTVPFDLKYLFDPESDFSSFVTLGGFPLTDDKTGEIIGLAGILRTANEKDRRAVLAVISEKLDQLQAESPVRFSYQLSDSLLVPDTVNDKHLERQMRGAIAEAIGEENLALSNNPVPFNSEDFAFYLQHIPGVFYWLGAANEARGIVGMPHLPNFDVDEDCIRVGVIAMSQLLLAYLKS